MDCSYKGCKRNVVSGSNIIADCSGMTYNVDLCSFHLKKLLWRDKDAVCEEVN